MSDSRPTVVLFGAATVVAALFAPWGALEVNDAVRAGLAQQTGALPEVIGNVTREMIGLLPDRIVGNGWEVIDKGDWVMTVCAILAVIAAFSARLGLAQLASSATILAILWVMVGPRGEFGEYVSLQWGAWLGLAGAGLMMIGACMRAPKPTQRGEDLLGWSSASIRSYPSDAYPSGQAYPPTAQPYSAARDTSHSVPPPGR